MNYLFLYLLKRKTPAAARASPLKTTMMTGKEKSVPMRFPWTTAKKRARYMSRWRRRQWPGMALLKRTAPAAT